MTRSISDMESRLYTIFAPTEAKSLVETTLNIFWKVSTSGSRLLIYLFLYKINVFGKISDIEAIVVLNVAIGNKTDSHGQAFIGKLHLIDDLTKSVF